MNLKWLVYLILFLVPLTSMSAGGGNDLPPSPGFLMEPKVLADGRSLRYQVEPVNLVGWLVGIETLGNQSFFTYNIFEVITPPSGVAERRAVGRSPMAGFEIVEKYYNGLIMGRSIDFLKGAYEITTKKIPFEDFTKLYEGENSFTLTIPEYDRGEYRFFVLHEQFTQGKRNKAYYKVSMVVGGEKILSSESVPVDKKDFETRPQYKHLFYHPFGGKPVIYLYPTKTQEVSVNVSGPSGVQISDPPLGAGWKVRATPEGKITNLADGKTYPYLFWEADQDHFNDFDTGFVVLRQDVTTFFKDKLKFLGLNPKEIADFLEFWVPKFQEQPFYTIHFEDQKEIDQVFPLTIEPTPDSVIRVLINYQGYFQRPVIKEQVLTPVQRKGFAVVEWGGLLSGQILGGALSPEEKAVRDYFGTLSKPGAILSPYTMTSVVKPGNTPIPAKAIYIGKLHKLEGENWTALVTVQNNGTTYPQFGEDYFVVTMSIKVGKVKVIDVDHLMISDSGPMTLVENYYDRLVNQQWDKAYDLSPKKMDKKSFMEIYSGLESLAMGPVTRIGHREYLFDLAYKEERKPLAYYTLSFQLADRTLLSSESTPGPMETPFKPIQTFTRTYYQF